MTASAGAWYRVGTVNVTNGQQSIVGMNTAWQNDVISIAVGDIFTLDAKTWYEVIAVNSDTSITLDREYEGNTQNSANYAIVRNTSGTILTRVAGQIAVQFNQKQLFLDELRKWLNSDNASEELTDSHGVKKSLKTPAQMVRDHDNKLAEIDAIHPYPWAMRKVEFEAMRAANNEKYAASGFVHFGKHFDRETVNLGLTCYSSSWGVPNTNRIWVGREINSSSFSVSSKTSSAVINIAGILTDLDTLADDYNGQSRMTTVKFSEAEDGTRTYDSATGVSVTHATPAIAFASETDTNKVVTDRVDMWGFEGFLRKITESNPFVYKHGLIQSLASGINGTATVSDNVRPITYFAWYEGDTTSRGKGVNWQTATEEQRIAIASDPKNNIYFDDATGEFYQWCIRGRSFAGAGNGDWHLLDASDPQGLLAFHISNPVRRVSSQGVSSNDIAFSSTPYYYNKEYANTAFSGIPTGLFQARDTRGDVSGNGINGDCYFLVCGTVNRLNQGAYHPSYNPSGTSTLVNTNGSRVNWSSVDSTRKLKSRSDCFNYFNSGGFVSDGNIGGGISSNLSGRPDGRYYDAIYASGWGGVCRDMRYSARGVTAEDFAEQDLAIKAGEYRGRELLAITKFYSGNVGGNTVSGGWQLRSYDGSGEAATGVNIALNTTNPTFASSLKYGKTFAVTDGTNVLVLKVTGNLNVNVYTLAVLQEVGNFPVIPGDSGQDSSNLSLLIDVESEVSISDQFIHTEVIGDPAKILLCEDLKNGWVGSWNPIIPDGVVSEFPLSRPKNDYPIASSINRVFTSDNGESWTKGTVPIDSKRNTTTGQAYPAGLTNMIYYTSSAIVVADSGNQEIFNGIDGLGAVFAGCYFGKGYGRELQFSLVGKTPMSSYSNQYETLTLNRVAYSVAYNNLHKSSSYPMNHTPIGIRAPENDSSAFKALNYYVAVNQQSFINYAYTELKYDTAVGDWGDDSEIHIADNQTTMPDENGHTVLVGTARCVEPLGWIKNDK